MAFKSGDVITSVWLNRRNNATLRPEDFGAIGDGSLDDTPALQQLINIAGINGEVNLTPGNTYAVTFLDLKEGTRLIGNGATIRFLPNTSTGGMSYCILMRPNCVISDCIFSFGGNLTLKNSIIEATGATGAQIYNNLFLAPEYSAGSKKQADKFLSSLVAVINCINATGIKVNSNTFKRFNRLCIKAQGSLSEINFNKFINIDVVSNDSKAQCLSLDASSEYQVSGNKFYNIGMESKSASNKILSMHYWQSMY